MKKLLAIFIICLELGCSKAFPPISQDEMQNKKTQIFTEAICYGLKKIIKYSKFLKTYLSMHGREENETLSSMQYSSHYSAQMLARGAIGKSLSNSEIQDFSNLNMPYQNLDDIPCQEDVKKYRDLLEQHYRSLLNQLR